MASQSFNLIVQEEEQELVAFETRQSRGPTPQSRPNSRMEEMLPQLIISQDATAKSLEKRIIEYTRALETKMSDLVNRTSTVVRSLQGSLALDRIQLGGVQFLRGMRSKTAKSSDLLKPITRYL